MSLLPESIAAEVLSLQQVAIHSQQYVQLGYRTAAGDHVERIGADVVPQDLAVGDRVVLHRQVGMTVRVERAALGA